MSETVEVGITQLIDSAPELSGLNIIIKLEILNEFRNEVLAELRKLDSKTLFKKSSGALLNSIGGFIIEDRIVFYSTKRYFKAQEDGVKPHTMWYLLGKTIPLRGESGSKPLFRKCTLKSIMNGKWKHPGYEGKHFVANTIELVKERLPAIVSRKIYQHTGIII